MRSTRPLLPWIVWGVACLAYAVAIINRSSLAALGPATQAHFGIDATTLAIFPVVQLIVYAGMQIPVGLYLDRIGPTAMVVIGGLLMVIGQVAMATVADVWLAILARIFVGAGDACTFISVMRILPDWFAVRQLPTVTQFTGLLGQTGQLISVTPLALLVAGAGWTAGFGTLAIVAFAVVVLTSCVMRDRPGSRTLFEKAIGRTGRISRNATSLAGPAVPGRDPFGPPETSLVTVPRGEGEKPLGLWGKTRVLFKIPGVRLAFWIHFSTPFSANLLLLLWGTPFLTGGVGLSTGAAAALLSLAVVSAMVTGVVLGPVLSRFIERRVWITVGITLLIVAVWVVVFLWPGTPPMWLVTLLFLVAPLGGPTSMIAFEVMRSYSPRSYAGLASGYVNTGGFTASLIVILFVGLILDAQGAGSPETYSLPAFKWAFASQLPIWLLGIVMILIERKKAKRWMEERGRKLR